MKRYTLGTFVRGDFKAIEAWLNERAAAGWEPEQFGLLFTRWKRTERTGLRWCLDLTHNKNQREQRREYVDLCREGGWELALFRSGMYFFRSVEGMDPPPVQTDPQLEKKQYNRYYIRSAILGVISILAVLAVYALIFLALDGSPGLTLQLMAFSWHDSWVGVLGLAALILWIPWALWRMTDFLRAVIVNRNEVRTSPRWIMWTNCAMNLVASVGAALWIVGVCLSGSTAYLIGYLIGMITVLIWRWFFMEFELYRGEKRTLRSALLVVVAFLVILILGRWVGPGGTWGKGEADFPKHYARLEEQPIVRSEDLGLDGVLQVKRAFTPMGEVWQVRDLLGHGDGWERMDSKSWLCCFDWQARLTLSQTMAELEWWADPANRAEAPGYLVVTAPIKNEVVPQPITLDWADEAWYGQWETGSVLLVRIGRQVTRIIAPVSLADHRDMVETRLCR